MRRHGAKLDKAMANNTPLPAPLPVCTDDSDNNSNNSDNDDDDDNIMMMIMMMIIVMMTVMMIIMTSYIFNSIILHPIRSLYPRGPRLRSAFAPSWTTPDNITRTAVASGKCKKKFWDTM
jgi:hypothetical protein